MSEVHEKQDIEIETIIAKTERAQIIDEPITTVQRNPQHQQTRTEAEIGCTRVLRDKNVAAAVSEILHLRIARIVLNVGVQIISNEVARV